MALARRYRLRLRRDFQAVKEKGQLVNGPFFSFLYLTPAKQIQIGFIVSRKISHRAVDRNLVRRRLSELARTQLGKIKPAQIIFLAKKEVLTADFQEMEKSLGELLQQARLVS